MAPFSFPSFAPANLQHRLLSFLVRRFLAPLLKDRGQSLDRQLSAQTQPAIFTLTDVDLDPGALEDLFAGSGLPLSILTASISELSLQINWPSWSFSLQDYVPDVKIKLHNIQLTLGISTPGPESLSNESQLLKNLDLDASLAHIADDFVRQEWPDSATGEEQNEHELPGAFSHKSRSPAPSKNEDRRGFFTGLVHNILAKFNFEFTGLSLLLRHQRVEALLLIDSGLSLALSAQDLDSVTSMSREIRVSPPVLHLQHLPTATDSASSLSSLNRSLDSDHDMFMSQGIADLRAPDLSTSTAELSTPASACAKSESLSAYITHLAKPENVVLQFLPIPALARATGLDLPTQESSTSEGVGPETNQQPLDPNDSLRFLFRISHGQSLATSSGAEPNYSKETRPLSAPLVSGQTTPAHTNECCHSRLDVQIRLPILSISVQSPQHVSAMTQLFSNLMIIMPTASETSASDIPIPSSNTQPLAIHVSLTCHQLNCTLNFPSHYSPSSHRSHRRDTPRSIELQAKTLTLAYSSVLSVGDKEHAFMRPRTEISFQLDQIQGAFSICHVNKASFSSKTFLSAPVADHPGPAVSASHTDASAKVDFSSIWVSPDLEALSIFKPAFVALQAAITLAEPRSCTARNVQHAKATATEPRPSIYNDIGGPSAEEGLEVSLYVPCLYIDLKAPIPREVKNAGQRQPGLVLGAVIKSLKITSTPLRSISCNVFEAALGFRVGAARGSPSHAPLSPFLGIAHPLPPSTPDAKHCFPGLFITHTCGQLPHAHFNPLKHSPKPTAITLETITIDLTKDQFDRLQCWLDDLGRWANESFSESDLSAEQPALSTALSGQSRANSVSLQDGPSNSDSTRLPSVQSGLLASMTVSQVALTLHLPPSEGCQDKGKQKCVFQMSHLLLDQLGPAPEDQFESELRLRVKSCTATLHDEGGMKSLLEMNTKEVKPSEEAVPAVLVSICTSPAQAPTCMHKQITVSIEVCHTALYFGPSCIWTSDLLRFLKAPAGVFEAVGPEYQTQIKLLFVACLLQFTPPAHDPPHQGSSCMLEVVSNRLECKVGLDPGATSISPQIKGALSIYLGDYPSTSRTSAVMSESISFARIASLSDMEVSGSYSWVSRKPTWRGIMHRGTLALSFCADSADSLSEAIDQLGKISFRGVGSTSDAPQRPAAPVKAAGEAVLKASMLKSALREPPSNARSLLIERDEDLAEEDYPADADFVEAGPRVQPSRRTAAKANSPFILRSLVGSGLNIIDDFLLHQRPWSKVPSQDVEGELKVEHLDVSVGLHSGYDWSSTRQAIHDAQKTVRKRLQKLRQLLATGNPADATIEDELAPTTLFKSLHLGMASSPHGLTTAQLLSAIDDELEKSPEHLIDDTESIIGSWQSLPLNSVKDHDPRATPTSRQHHSLGRSAQPMLKVVLAKLQCYLRKFDDATPDHENPHRRISSFHLKAESLTVIDNIPTSTWKKFLTELRPSEGGMMRPTGSPMLRMKFDILPSSEQSRQREGFFKLKITPLRLYVDQDAVDFMKNFFAFHKDSCKPRQSDSAGTANGMFFQRVEVLPIRIRLDYKPKRINYMALREGKAIELMNFFHFESSDMVLRHATLIGLTRASKIGELLQDIWTPDVKANQLADVISGIAPVRSVVNVGSGIADLLLLPIEQVRKDGRWTRGLQKGTTSFAKSTALEAIKLGAKLATGTQVVLERAEAILGARLPEEMRVETVESGSPTTEFRELDNDRHPAEMISRYADQPENVKMGAKLAYRDFRDNIRTTAQTILAVPLEVFNEGSGQAVVKAVPIAILHPMVGATGAISKTLLGLRNTLDPHASDNDEDKYKRTSSSR